MELEQISLPIHNKLLSDYWSGSEKLKPFYEYEYSDESFQKRAQYLKRNFYDTKELSRIIRAYMEPLGLSEKAREHLDYLENGALAIVGGQQAGILTGPLYSVHKALSVLLLAKEQSEKLDIPIVPIFWIAGEDHDFDEINHTYTTINGEVYKRAYNARTNKKLIASATEIHKEEMTALLDTIFKDFGETEYTKELYNRVMDHMSNSCTFTDFFARLMNELFQQEGLLLIDAAFTPFRKFESSFFTKLIYANETIAKSVFEKEQQFNELGYGMPIQAVEKNANLFYVQDGERFLLERNGNEYKNSTGTVQFTEEELLHIAENSPEQLSNNVVTRPLMQEMTIPVLAFVGGPGELAYWGTLKDAFTALDLQMPILAPRMNITIIPRNIDQLLSNYHLPIEQVFNGGVNLLKDQFITSIQDEEALSQIQALNELLDKQYDLLNDHLIKQQINLQQLVERNKQYHKRQFDYLSTKIEEYVLTQHDKTIRQFNKINAVIYPSEQFQERLYNPYQFINLYGPTFISSLMKLPFRLSEKHNIVHL